MYFSLKNKKDNSDYMSFHVPCLSTITNRADLAMVEYYANTLAPILSVTFGKALNPATRKIDPAKCRIAVNETLEALWDEDNKTTNPVLRTAIQWQMALATVALEKFDTADQQQKDLANQQPEKKDSDAAAAAAQQPPAKKVKMEGLPSRESLDHSRVAAFEEFVAFGENSGFHVLSGSQLAEDIMPLALDGQSVFSDTLDIKVPFNPLRCVDHLAPVTEAKAATFSMTKLQLLNAANMPYPANKAAAAAAAANQAAAAAAAANEKKSQ